MRIRIARSKDHPPARVSFNLIQFGPENILIRCDYGDLPSDQPDPLAGMRLRQLFPQAQKRPLIALVRFSQRLFLTHGILLRQPL
jgi:hypothetical protein